MYGGWVRLPRPNPGANVSKRANDGAETTQGHEPTLVEKVATAGISLAAGWAAQKAITALWKQYTGHDAPQDLDDDEANIAGIVAFAAVSAAAAALVRVLARRGTTRAAHRIAIARTSSPSA